MTRRHPYRHYTTPTCLSRSVVGQTDGQHGPPASSLTITRTPLPPVPPPPPPPLSGSTPIAAVVSTTTTAAAAASSHTRRRRAVAGVRRPGLYGGVQARPRGSGDGDTTRSGRPLSLYSPTTTISVNDSTITLVLLTGAEWRRRAAARVVRRHRRARQHCTGKHAATSSDWCRAASLLSTLFTPLSSFTQLVCMTCVGVYTPAAAARGGQRRTAAKTRSFTLHSRRRW
jgi:hypothetical protein